MTVNRRQFLKRTIAAGGAAMLPGAIAANGSEMFPIPEATSGLAQSVPLRGPTGAAGFYHDITYTWHSADGKTLTMEAVADMDPMEREIALNDMNGFITKT